MEFFSHMKCKHKHIWRTIRQSDSNRHMQVFEADLVKKNKILDTLSKGFF
jgi:hypothetical protein